jgi:hypothetical protein
LSDSDRRESTPSPTASRSPLSLKGEGCFSIGFSPLPGGGGTKKRKNRISYERSHDVIENKGSRFLDPTMLLKLRHLRRFATMLLKNSDLDALRAGQRQGSRGISDQKSCESGGNQPPCVPPKNKKSKILRTKPLCCLKQRKSDFARGRKAVRCLKTGRLR